METIRNIVGSIVVAFIVLQFFTLLIGTSIFRFLFYWLNYPGYKEEVSLLEEQRLIWTDVEKRMEKFIDSFM